jgi:hypothetical protein
MELFSKVASLAKTEVKKIASRKLQKALTKVDNYPAKIRIAF